MCPALRRLVVRETARDDESQRRQGRTGPLVLDREWSEEGIDHLREVVGELNVLAVGELAELENLDAGFVQSGKERLVEELVLVFDEGEDALSDQADLLSRA